MVDTVTHKPDPQVPNQTSLMQTTMDYELPEIGEASSSQRMSEKDRAQSLQPTRAPTPPRGGARGAQQGTEQLLSALMGIRPDGGPMETEIARMAILSQIGRRRYGATSGW